MSEVKQEGDFKIKSKKTSPKQLGNQSNEPIKVNIDEVKEPVAEEVAKVVIPEVEESGVGEPVVVVNDTPDDTVKDGIIEIVDEEVQNEVEVLEEQFDNALTNNEETGAKLPENIEKLVSFMEETGGTISDYVRLNADYSSVDDKTLLKEYYKQTKPYLESDDVSLLLEDYDYDEDLDEERDIRKKKIAFKEEVAKAKGFLENTKSKYYDEIKLRPGVTQEQQKAMEFFNRYQEDQKIAEQQHSDFKSKTNDYFTNEFKGFDFNVGEKKFRYGLQDPNKVAENQSSINNFVGKFLDESGNIKDTKGYHKAIYIASNADKIINHFYEQGRTDATKEIVSSSKNPSTEPRQTSSGEFVNGIKIKSISGPDSSKLRIKTKKFN